MGQFDNSRPSVFSLQCHLKVIARGSDRYLLPVCSCSWHPRQSFAVSEVPLHVSHSPQREHAYRLWGIFERVSLQHQWPLMPSLVSSQCSDVMFSQADLKLCWMVGWEAVPGVSETTFPHSTPLLSFLLGSGGVNIERNHILEMQCYSPKWLRKDCVVLHSLNRRLSGQFNMTRK